ncbi:hypothetical protein [Pontibacter sp. G13]|uniref:hypothetical protein n=1 Tax=Pontibacter sp. G13 TaxID=3074898 RepID=UPI00288971FE|nr:hypothetical protein [Pontibacter sp. G13]WNJ19480.1 hypothetical protein RJD25_03215 [Pontibacter sp. G13]
MATIVQSDQTYINSTGTAPNYNLENPVWKLANEIQQVDWPAGREFYVTQSLDYLFPYKHLELYNEAGKDGGPVVPWEQQFNKNDFQKQNIKDFTLEHFFLVRGYVNVEGNTFPFLKVSYDGGTKSPLSEMTNHNVGASLQMWVRVRNAERNQLITVPYNPRTHRYEVELWAHDGNNLREMLGTRGQESLDAGLIQPSPDLIQGGAFEFSREAVAGTPQMYNINPNHTMHPIFPLPVQLAFANADASVWDSLNGANYRVEFNMIFRGWNSYIQGGVSPNPHGGVGYLEFRNLFSNYFNHTDTIGNELGRDLQAWNLNADGNLNAQPSEKFMAVEYMDLHVLKPTCAIGIHRHKDNQEIFMMLRGSALMITGDWLQFPTRMRAFEARSMKPGDLVLCKNGMLHSLINLTDEDIELFMFGGYD